MSKSRSSMRDEYDGETDHSFLAAFVLCIYHACIFVAAFYVLLTAVPELLEWNGVPLVNMYAYTYSPIRNIFQWMEAGMLLEVVLHLFGFTNLKRHMVIQYCSACFILFAVISQYPTHKWVLPWVCVRATIKLIRSFYHVYTLLGFKFLFYPIDWLRMTCFYVLQPADYVLGTICVLITAPVVKDVKDFTWEVYPNTLRIDLTIFYYIYLPTSVFVFITTFVYLHQKRSEQLAIAARLPPPHLRHNAAKARRHYGKHSVDSRDSSFYEGR